MNIVVKEFRLDLWGKGNEAWNAMRRTGKPINAKILELEGGSLDQREIFKNRIQDLSFRPKLLMGMPQATEITLEYKMFSKLKN